MHTTCAPHARHDAIHAIHAQVSLYCGNFVQGHAELRQDCVFLDPPWGGPDMMFLPKVGHICHHYPLTLLLPLYYLYLSRHIVTSLQPRVSSRPRCRNTALTCPARSLPSPTIGDLSSGRCLSPRHVPSPADSLPLPVPQGAHSLPPPTLYPSEYHCTTETRSIGCFQRTPPVA